MSPNRVVAVLTPLLFAPLAGAVSAWIANHFPGVDIKQSDLQAIFIGGALIALAPAAQWLHGWQKYEARQADAELLAQGANATIAAPVNVGQHAEPVEAASEGPFTLDELLEFDELDEPLTSNSPSMVSEGD